METVTEISAPSSQAQVRHETGETSLSTTAVPPPTGPGSESRSSGTAVRAPAVVAPGRPLRAWIYPDDLAGPEGAPGSRGDALAKEVQVSPLLGRLLCRRGIATPVEARAFLDPVLSQLHDPLLLPDMAPALARLDAAITAREPILLYSDYDVDGNTGAAILYDVLRRLGAVVSVHVPDRVKDGYGLKVERLRRARAEGVCVVISIDNGVTAVDEARFCREVGLDLIVTDHHTLKAQLPEALAVIHPRVPGSRYPNPDLCGAGVAFKLAWAIAARRGTPRAGEGAAATRTEPPGAGVAGCGRPTPELRDRLLSALGLVALGTIADVVALKGENRTLVRHGLKVLSLGPTPGIRALLAVVERERSGSSGRKPGVDATQVAFQIAPRLNAAGRMGDASRAFRLLAAETDAEARSLADELDRENSRRRNVQKETTESARAEVERVYSRAPEAGLGDAPSGARPGLGPEVSGIVVGGEDWPLGVVGIVAAKLVEEHRRPCLVLAIDGDHAKGSGRSVPEVDLLRCLERCKEHLESYGGHAAACGLSIKREGIEAFRRAWTASVAQEMSERRAAGLAAGAARAAASGSPVSPLATELGEHVLEIDLEVELSDVHQSFVRELELLEPFGQGNRAPILAVRGVELVGEPRPMGQSGDHCSFFVRKGDAVLRAVAFSRRDLLDVLRARGMRGPQRERFELAFRPKINHFNGKVSVELEAEEIRFTA